MKNLQEKFQEVGGRFITPLPDFKIKLEKIKALVFDWDGVFNNGSKSVVQPATFSEADSMGLNILRFDLWCKQQILPKVFIVTGEDNPTALHFSQRENLHGIYKKIKNKTDAIAHLCANNKIEPCEIACFGEDLTDLSMFKICGLRFLLKRSASPLLEEYIVQSGLCDYVTGHSGYEHGVREATELLMGMQGSYADRISARYNFDQQYQSYITERGKIQPRFFLFDGEVREYFL